MNIKAALAGWLPAHLSDSEVVVATNVPKKRPKKLVVIGREGGAIDSVVIDHPLVSLQCFHETDEKADALAAEIDDLVRNTFIHEAGVTKVTRNSFGDYPDIVGGIRIPCSQLVFNITTN